MEGDAGIDGEARGARVGDGLSATLRRELVAVAGAGSTPEPQLLVTLQRELASG